MYIVRLWGGIGNQLFQYAFGEFLRYNCNLDVRYDIASFGNSDKLREYELAIIAPNLPTVNNIRFSRYRGIVNRCLKGDFKECPYYQFGDEYQIVRKQM